MNRYPLKKSAFDLGLPLPPGPDDGVIDVYVSTFGNVDLVGDVVAATAYDRWLAEVRADKRSMPILYQHRHDSPEMVIGAVLYDGWEVDGKGLRARVLLDVERNDTALTVF